MNMPYAASTQHTGRKTTLYCAVPQPARQAGNDCTTPSNARIRSSRTPAYGRAATQYTSTCVDCKPRNVGRRDCTTPPSPGSSYGNGGQSNDISSMQRNQPRSPKPYEHFIFCQRREHEHEAGPWSCLTDLPSSGSPGAFDSKQFNGYSRSRRDISPCATQVESRRYLHTMTVAQKRKRVR